MTIEVNEVPKSAIELRLTGLSKKSSARLDAFTGKLQIADKFSELSSMNTQKANTIFAKYLTVPTSSNIA